MTKAAGTVTSFGPTTVAVHDDGKMFGQFIWAIIHAVGKALNRHQFLLFGFHDSVDVFDGFVSDLLNFIFRCANFVFGGRLFFQHFFHVLNGIPTHVTDGHLGIFTITMHLFG